MKKYMIVAIILCGMLMFAGVSSAYMVGSTEVGGLDTFWAQSEQISSPANELAWINERFLVRILLFIIHYHFTFK
jgi:hypothetical protein